MSQATFAPIFHPTCQQTEEIIDLWRYCFQDSDPFIDWYFTNYYQPSYTYALQENNEKHIAAVLQCNPYFLNIRKKELPVSYITGVCTHPAYRGNGYFQHLLQQTLNQLADRKLPLAILLPIATNLYSQYQFAYYCHRLDYTLSMEDISNLLTKEKFSYTVQKIDHPEKNLWQFAEIYQQYTQTLHGYACRKEKNWQNLMKDWQMDHCHYALFFTDNKPVAYLVYRLQSERIEIIEMAYMNPSAHQMIWRYLYQHRTQGTKVIWSAPENDNLLDQIPHWQGKCQLHPFMMARILSLETLLQQITYPQSAHESILLAITDPIISLNNGIFCLTIENGAATVQKMPIAQEKNISDCCKISIAGLGQLIMGKKSSRDLAQQGDLKGTENQIQQLEIIFPLQHNFINEFF